MITFEDEEYRTCFTCVNSVLKPFGLYCESRRKRVEMGGTCKKWSDYPEFVDYAKNSESD